jgi:multidrug efflux pump subunit AcrB
MSGGWISRHSRALLLLILLPVVAGALVVFVLPISLFPSVSFPRVRVSLDAGARPARQMELQVTAPVELAVHGIRHVVDVRSTTSRGSAEVSVFFDWGTDMVAATLQVNAAIAEIAASLPAGTKMTTQRMDPTVFPVIAYSLTSDSIPLGQLRDIATYQLRPSLLGVTGLARVGVTGGSDQEYHVIADPSRLRANGLTIADVAKAVTSTNVLKVVGRIEDQFHLLLVVSDETVKTLDELRNTVVRASPGAVIRIDDVARVENSAVPAFIKVTADGKDAILLNIYEQPAANIVQLAKDVKDRLTQAQKTLPAGIKFGNWYDQSLLVTDSAKSVRDAILIGAVLAALVLLVFLRSFKVTLIAVAVLPAALAATVVLLYALGMSFNIMTLGGIAAAVGLIVDDAICMVEHIVKRLDQSDCDADLRQGVLAAAAEFTKPLTGSSAATIVIFLPLAFLTGVTGAFFKALSLTMASALIFSFGITFLAVPLLAQWLLTGKKADKPKGRLARTANQMGLGRLADRLKSTSALSAFASFRQKLRRLARRLKSTYGSLSATLIRHSFVVVLACTLPIAAIGYFSYQSVGSGFIPHMDEGGFILDYYSTPGTALSETDRLLVQVEAILKNTPEVKTWSRRTGAQLGGGVTEPNVGDFFVRLKPLPRRPIDEVMASVRSAVNRNVPGLHVALAQLIEDEIGDLTSVPQPIEVKLFGADTKELLSTARKVAAKISKVAGIVDVKNGINPAGDSLDVRIDPTKASLEGVDPKQATAIVNDYLSGQVATKIPTDLKEIGVRVWSPPNLRNTRLDIGELPIRATDGHVFPLERIATFTIVTGQPEIERENLQRLVAVTARIQGRSLGSVAGNVRTELDKAGFLPKTVRYELGGVYQQQQIAFNGLLKVFAAALVSVFILLMFLYESFAIAASILLMPLLATCGVFLGLMLTGVELNITAMMGMTMIIGIVTEVAIFYFSEYKDLVEVGHDRSKALVEAGQNRFRAIAMTTLAAILTLLPLAFAIGAGSAMLQPLAVAIISGLLVQMPMVLLVMPSVFVLFGGLRGAPHRETGAPIQT